VSFPDTSGVRTISFTTPLQLRQTPAHATTSRRPGHLASASSTLASTSRRSSGGSCAQQLCRRAASTGSTAATRLTRPGLCGWDRKPRREMAPISPFISWIMVLKGMAFLVRSSPAAENSRASEFQTEFRQSSASFQLKRDRSAKNGIFMNCDSIQVTSNLQDCKWGDRLLLICINTDVGVDFVR
jgi:hypothetical protein